MIGDNPAVDIKGGNESGFTTILVKTGVYHETNNKNTFYPDYVVEDVYEAINLILQLEKI